MFPSGIVQILTLPKYSLKQQINRDEDSTRLFDRTYTWCAARANPWEEAHWRGHVPSACHSTNHLGEGLREEPIVALAGHHLNAGERVNRKHWSMRAGVAGEAGQRGGCASLMTWKRSRLAIECDEWGGAGLHNLIQTTLPPHFAQILNHQGSCDLRVIYVLLMTVDVSGLWHKHETTLWMQIIKMQSCRKYSHLSVRGKCKHKVKKEMLLDLDTESICFLMHVNDERWMLMFLNTLVWSCIGLYSHAVCAYDIGETPEVPRTCFLWPLTAAHCNVCILKYCWHVQVIIQK